VLRSSALVLVIAVGCGDNLRPATRDAAPTDAVVADARPDAAPTCGTTVTGFPLVAGAHVATCSAVTYPTNPPTSGPHYPIWARYKTYDARVGRPFWVHDLEHGAVVVTYHCPDGCADEVAALIAFLDARPVDPTCTAPLRNRFVVTPDPELDVRFAASSWGFALRSSCFDLTALGAFIDAHYAHAPEDTCADGVDVLNPLAGFPPNCP
jgi:hypothetical protein